MLADGIVRELAALDCDNLISVAPVIADGEPPARAAGRAADQAGIIRSLLRRSRAVRDELNRTQR